MTFKLLLDIYKKKKYQYHVCEALISYMKVLEENSYIVGKIEEFLNNFPTSLNFRVMFSFNQNCILSFEILEY
jgi:hypothetical protein